ncbi:MAG TPA: cytochrome C [Oceanospirillales bacterium]|nr:cytochrome C [Oceanospirillales bacterium]
MKTIKLILVLPIILISFHAYADDFTQEDLDRWQNEFMQAVKQGEKLFHGGLGNENTVSCDQCHPNGTNIHPETYPKFQQQLGKVVILGEMINWCIQNPLESKHLKLDSEEMVALQAYIHWERKSKPLAPGKH